MIRTVCCIAALLLLAGCGGGGGGGGATTASTAPTNTTTPPPATLTNFTTVTVDNGPAALDTGPDAYTDDDTAFVTVTLCVPGSTTNCQSIDHVLVDTGSVGLRLFPSVLNASLLSALPTETDTSKNPVAECYTFVDGYIFGSVRQADFQIGGESVADMPLQLIGDTGVFANVPATCSAGGGTNLNTLQAFGANGIIGIGVTQADCGAICAAPGGYSSAIYYDCPTGGCSTIISRAASTTAPFQQLPNPVAAMAVDNNGTILSLPAAPAAGEATATGTLYFGIGTQTNNALGSATVLTTTTSTSSSGPGFVTAVYNKQNLVNSFIDSGSNAFYFVDTSQTLCPETGFTGFYCPAAPTGLVATLEGLNSVSASANFTLNNAQTILSTGNAVAPGVGGNPDDIVDFFPIPLSFDFGLTFFYGRPIYTAIEGRAAGGVTGPYFAY